MKSTAISGLTIINLDMIITKLHISPRPPASQRPHLYSLSLSPAPPCINAAFLRKAHTPLRLIMGNSVVKCMNFDVKCGKKSSELRARLT